MSTTIDIGPIRYDTLPNDGLFVVVGKRRQGKTTMTEHLLNVMSGHDDGIFIVMASSEKVKSEWSKRVHGLYVVDPSIEYLIRLRDKQNELIGKHERQRKPFPSALQVTLVLDDMGSNKDVLRSSIVAWLASNGRQVNLRLFILVQFLTQLTNDVRAQADILVVLATANKTTLSRLHTEYAGHSDLRIFRSVLGGVTDNRGALIIDNRINATSLSDHCFYMSSPYPVEVKPLGNPGMRRFADMHYMVLKDSSNRQVSTLLQDDDDDEDDGDSSLLPLSKEQLAVLDNRKIFTDRMGTIIVRKMLHPKTKIE